ncbi:platelet glycoprotein Ib alpha chain [Aedes albopictus]|uniref:Membrane glycoprotein lig-1 n=1 Tax=Aedes albopictus TaxID=7160 RepID=A0ABM1YXW1_AEDAL|nr:platelet glycoprotein Ib alpha chain-like [Aedes albopictus]
MKLLLGICLFLVGVAASTHTLPRESGPMLSCLENSHDQAYHIENLLVEPTALLDGLSFPDVPVLYLDNSTTSYFSPQLMEKVQNSTESLFILDGIVAKVYLKPTLKALTVLRAVTSEVLIDPVDNHRLEILDIEGRLKSIPDNIRHLKKLVTLDLCQNQITSWNLNDLEGLDHLRKLNLGHNQIGSIISTKEMHLPALKELFLHGNRITTLDLTHLKADRLERLYLSHYWLTIVKGLLERYSQLRRVDLHGNDWKCVWLRRALDVLEKAGVESLNYLPIGVCDERGSVKVDSISCD